MKILFVDTAHSLLTRLLSEAGYDCIDGSQLSRTELLNEIGRYEGIIIRSRIKVDEEFIDKATKLKFIGRVGAGMESIDVDYAEKKGIACINSPEGNRDAVAEHAVGMLLMLLNNLNRADKEVRQGQWIREGNRGTELMGKTIGIIGFGKMGSAFAQRIYCFGVKILAYDKYKTGFGNKFVKESNMEEIFSDAEVLSLHLPLTDETEFLINDSYINSFKKNIYLINTARGKCVKTDDLVKNLKSGKVLGACLDVNEYEHTSFEGLTPGPSPTERGENAAWDYLIHSDNVILTPHIAGWSHESNEKLARVLAEKIIKAFGSKNV